MYLNIPWYYFIFIRGSRYADDVGNMFVEDCWVIVVRNVPIFYDILGVFYLLYMGYGLIFGNFI